MKVYELHMRNGEVIRVENHPGDDSKSGAIYIDGHGHANVCQGATRPSEWDRQDVYPAGEWKSLRISMEVIRG